MATSTMTMGPGGGGDVKLFRIRLLGHCIFCLRKTSRNKELLKTIPRYSAAIEELEEVPISDVDMLTFNGNLLATLNRIWPCLQEGKREGGQGDPFPIFELSEDKGASGARTRFSRLPKMCHFCGEKLEAVDRLWRELADQMKRLRETIKESKFTGKYAWRAEMFEKSLRNSDLEVDTILEFLEIKRIERNVDVSDPHPDDDSSIQDQAQPMKDRPTPEIIITGTSENDRNIADCQASSVSQPVLSSMNEQSEECRRPGSVEIISSTSPTPLAPQQFREIHTNPDEEMSVDRAETDASTKPNPVYVDLESETVIGNDNETPHKKREISSGVANAAFLRNTTECRRESSQSCPTLVPRNSGLDDIANRNYQSYNHITSRPELVNAKKTTFVTSHIGNRTTIGHLPQSIRRNIYDAHNIDISNQLRENVIQSRDRRPGMVQCSQCHSVFPSWGKLVDHMSKHRDSGLPCDICKDGVKYFIHNLLREHYCTVHGIGEQFPCTLCPAVYFTPQALKTHMKTRHKNDSIHYPQLRN